MLSRSSIALFATFAVVLVGWWLLSLGSSNSVTEHQIPDLESYEAMLAAHPYANRPRLTPEQLKGIPKQDRPDLAIEQDFLKTMDPATGDIPIERLYEANLRATELKAEAEARGGGPLLTEPWAERGPANVGGRTRVILFDPNDTNGLRVFAGGVGGGLWVTEDISASNDVWTPVNDVWENLAVTAIAADPSNPQIMYVGTGEGHFNLDAIRGAGIFRSDDGGLSWTLLPSTTDNSSFHYTHNIAVHPTTGDVYAATRSGLFRSQDDGSSWETVLTGRANDIEIVDATTFYVTTGLFTIGRVYSSTTGNNGEWTQLNNDANGFPSTGIHRIELATSPIDPLLIYAVTQSSSTFGVGGMYRSDDGGLNWTSIPRPNDVEYGSDFSRGQAWYDLSIEADPTSTETLYVGGINLFRTTNGGTTWTQLSHWFGGFGYPYVHADQHAIALRPGLPNEAIVSHDGGVNFTADITSTPVSWVDRNDYYNVTQFYAGAIAPDEGSNIMLAGAQDNGTQRFDGAGIDFTVEARGGDGAFTFIDQTNASIAISSYVYNTYQKSINGGASFSITLTNDLNTGSFINPADYDNRENILYSYRTSSTLYRILDVEDTPSVGTITVSMGGTATHLSVSPYSPTGTSTLYVGTIAGRIFRIENAESTPVVTELTNPGSGAVSSLEFADSEDRILLTKSNYGVVSVYETLDGGTTWTSKEGDLPDMPVRWGMYNPLNYNEVLLATEAGVWETQDISESDPPWTPAPAFPTVSTHMLQFRESDGTVMATTHGRGVFTARFNGYVVANEPTQIQNVPSSHTLSSAYPNPFNPQTRFTLNVQESQQVGVILLDVRGRQVATLNDGVLAAGSTTEFEIDGRELPSGTYIVSVTGEHFRDQLRVTLNK